MGGKAPRPDGPGLGLLVLPPDHGCPRSRVWDLGKHRAYPPGLLSSNPSGSSHPRVMATRTPCTATGERRRSPRSQTRDLGHPCSMAELTSPGIRATRPHREMGGKAPMPDGPGLGLLVLPRTMDAPGPALGTWESTALTLPVFSARIPPEAHTRASWRQGHFVRRLVNSDALPGLKDETWGTQSWWWNLLFTP